MSSALPTQVDLEGALQEAPQVVNSQVITSFAESLIDQPNFAELDALYQQAKIVPILQHVLQYLQSHQDTVDLPSQLGEFIFQKPVELEIYVTEPVEGRAINLDARGKDYATNILSYPSELPEAVLELLPTLPLGELVICHDVVVSQATEQGKTVEQHLTHLLVHGILHLLGFDHELGQAEQDEMEAIEIAVLDKLSIANPYE